MCCFSPLSNDCHGQATARTATAAGSRPKRNAVWSLHYYAGPDVSLEETAICVVDGSGLIVREVRAASEPEALIATLQAIDMPLERIGLEACSLTAWLHDGLRGAGLPAIGIETRQANAAMKTMPNKTDRNDAGRLLRSCGRGGSGQST